ncbi:putative phospholipid-transporting ATPase IM isoform X3 [Phthorimaea operculella]|nr:putative phospholipid-transporting ATPase IM isoform X3 [Phthorimaea operculella]
MAACSSRTYRTLVAPVPEAVRARAYEPAVQQDGVHQVHAARVLHQPRAVLDTVRTYRTLVAPVPEAVRARAYEPAVQQDGVHQVHAARVLHQPRAVLDTIRSSLQFPKLYAPGHTSQLFNKTEFIKSTLHGCFTSLVLFLIPYGTYKDGLAPDGKILSDHMLLGSVVATILIIDNTTQIVLDTSYWTVFNHITIWGSLVSYFVLDYFYNYVVGGRYVGSLTVALTQATFWFTAVLTVVILMVPYNGLHNVSNLMYFLWNTLYVNHGVFRSVRSGYAFAHQEGFGRLITSGKIMKRIPHMDAAVSALASLPGKFQQRPSTPPVSPSPPSPSPPHTPPSPRAPRQDLGSVEL